MGKIPTLCPSSPPSSPRPPLPSTLTWAPYPPLPPSASISSVLLQKLLGEYWPPPDPLTSPPCLLPPPWPRRRPYPMPGREWEEEESKVRELQRRWRCWNREKERTELTIDAIRQLLSNNNIQEIYGKV